MEKGLKDKVVLITGATSGIGKATAHAFGKEGAKVAICGRNHDNLEKAVAELKADGASVFGIKCDVSDQEQVHQLIEATVSHFGGLDILVNNAGIGMRALFNELDLAVLKQVIDINFWGTVYCTKFALPHLLESKGSVVGVSSIAGYRGLPARTGYSSSKFAVHGFLESLRTENLKTGLHVMLICPGFTKSNIRKAALGKDGSSQGESPRDEKGMMSAEEVAKELVNGVKKRKRDVILTTLGKLTVFLNKWFPAWMDKKVYEHMAKEKDSPFN